MNKYKVWSMGVMLGLYVSVPAYANSFPTRPLWMANDCIATSSASALAASSRRLQEGSLIYQALFDNSDWSGEVRAFAVAADGSLGTARWRTVTSMPSSTTGAPPTRTLLTYDGAAGRNFAWESLTLAQQQSFLATDETLEAHFEHARTRFDWLRGGNDGAVLSDGEQLRSRSRLLGDVVNSNLLYVGAQDNGYYVPNDASVTGEPADSYSDYVTSKTARTPLVVFGANDGMLHALDADNGAERFAYVPANLYPRRTITPGATPGLAALSASDYAHRFYVDGSLGVGDIYDSGWKTYIAGGFGYGARGIFALDVTDSSFGPADVLWEHGAPDSSVATDWKNHLGHIFGEPTIARLMEGSNSLYVTLFGNGYASNDGRASLNIVNAKTGVLIKRLPVPDTSLGNGLSTAAVFMDSTRHVTHVYAGDLLGNLWKFDLSSKQSNQWSVSLLFAAGTTQPITGKVRVVSHPEGGRLVVFGTGRYLYAGDHGNSELQTLYGIWDSNSNASVQKSALLRQDLSDSSAVGFRALSQNAMSWTTYKGWYLDLPVGGERVLSAPSVSKDRAVFTTFTPSSASCAYGDSWVIGVDLWSGGRLRYSLFDVNGDKYFNSADVVACGSASCSPSGYKLPKGTLDGPGSLLGEGVDFGYSSSLEGTIDRFDLSGSGSRPGRMSWRQIR